MQTPYNVDVKALSNREKSAWSVASFLSAFLVVCGVASLAMWSPLVEAASYSGLPKSAVVIGGIVELALGALVMFRKTSFYAALVAALVSFAAMYLSLKYSPGPIAIIPALTCLLSIALCALRFEYARVHIPRRAHASPRT